MARSPAPSATAGRPAPAPSTDPSDDRRSAALWPRVRSLVRAIEDNDEAKVEQAILRLSSSRRVFAPLAFAIGAFVMLYDGLRLLVSNWRLTLVQMLPAMWIWLAMFDLKAHTLHGNSFNVLRGPVLIPSALRSSSSRSRATSSTPCSRSRSHNQAASRSVQPLQKPDSIGCRSLPPEPSPGYCSRSQQQS